MAHYRKKLIVIEAHQLSFGNINWVADWCDGQVKGIKLPIEDRCLDIYTLEGEMRADMHDWVIKGVKGEFSPCKPNIFEQTYEKVEE